MFESRKNGTEPSMSRKDFMVELGITAWDNEIVPSKRRPRRGTRMRVLNKRVLNHGQRKNKRRAMIQDSTNKEYA